MDRFVKVITTGVRCVVHLLLFQQRSQHSFYKECKKRATLVGLKARGRGVFKPTHCLLSKNVLLSFMDPPYPIRLHDHGAPNFASGKKADRYGRAVNIPTTLNGFIAMPLTRHKKISFLFFVAAAFLLMSQTATGLCAPSGPLALTHRTTMPECIHESGEWALLIFVTERGTHSQGIHGELYHRGKRVMGKQGDVRVTPFGRVHHHGSEAQRAELWQSSGWILHQGNGPMAPNTTTDKKNAPTHFGIG